MNFKGFTLIIACLATILAGLSSSTAAPVSHEIRTFLDTPEPQPTSRLATPVRIDTLSNDSITICSSQSLLLLAGNIYSTDTSYLWSTGDTSFSIIATYVGEPASTYWCTRKAKDNLATDELTDSITISYLPPYAYLGNDTSFCYLETSIPESDDTLAIYDLHLQNQGLDVTYRWTNAQDKVLGTDSTIAITLDMLEKINENFYQGMLAVSVTSGTTPYTCQANDTIIIRLVRFPHVFDTNLFIPRDTMLCAHSEITLCIPESDTTNYFSFNWLDADSLLLPYGEDTLQFTIEGMRGTDGYGLGTDTRQPTRYMLQYQHEYCPWIGFDTLDVYHIVKPWVVIPTDTLICRNVPVKIDPELPKVYEDFYEPEWSDGEKEAKREIAEGGEFILSYKVKEEINICRYSSGTDTILVTWVDTAMTNLYIPTDTIICVDNQLELDATNPCPSTRYSWQKGSIPVEELEIDSIQFTGPKITIEEEGVYNILLLDTMGCYNHQEINVTLDDCIPSLDIPNVFTPNGDGINDVLKFRTIEKCTDIDIQIVNRWGRTVLRTQVKTAEDFEWNGCMHNSNRKLPDGPYFYMISYKDFYGKRKVQSGSVTILGSAGL